MNKANDEVEFDILAEPRVNYKKTYPTFFGGRRWWLTEEEMNHYLLIKQYFPVTWEAEVYKRMDTLTLGWSNCDPHLQMKIKQES